MLFGAFGMMSSMAILSGTSSTATINEFNAPVLSTTYGVVATIFLFGFNTFFAIGWLGMAWLYPAEINTLKVRIQANALSTCSNCKSTISAEHRTSANQPRDHELLDRHDYTASFRQPAIQYLHHVRRLLRMSHPICILLLPGAKGELLCPRNVRLGCYARLIRMRFLGSVS